ncbi:MAG TPA: 3'-5' exonuclease [Bacteroidales bacterium]|nr:3'-5' exonuclease [Bacteroidales bacterium]HOH22315.1 3'-5' exonuclease [Bacteroidales bacterium]HPZ03248.1 3'-5' exonuclease [Bacteroidales bacterium]HQB74631.1 3'-5' exonuclease [Bacteroidales bacterium]
MQLNLQKPLLFFDLETTGLNVGKDRIVEIAMIKVMPDGTEQEYYTRINPEIPISKEAMEVHKISNEDLIGKPTFKGVAEEIRSFIADSDLAGFNSNKFDLPLLIEEFLRVDVDFDLRDRKIIDVQNIFHKMEPRTLIAACRFYCEEEILNPHNAMEDTRATYKVLKGQIKKYDGQVYENSKTGRDIQIKNDVNVLSQLSSESRTVDLVGHIIFNDKDEEVFNFGKHKGKRVKDVFLKEPSYYFWIMDAEFPLYTKRVVSRIYDEVQFEKKSS